MSDFVPLVLGGAIGLYFLDRVLRWMDGRGWIYYRESKPGRGAVGYHILETGSVFNPSLKEALRRHQAQIG